MDILTPDASPVKAGAGKSPNPRLGRVLDAYVAKLAAVQTAKKKLKSATGRQRQSLQSAFDKQVDALNAARIGLVRGLAAVMRTAASCHDPLAMVLLFHLRGELAEVLS